LSGSKTLVNNLTAAQANNCMNQPTANSQDSDALRNELVETLTQFETNFRNRFPLVWLITLLMPFVLTAAILLLLGLWFGWDTPRNVISHALLTFFLLGRFVILVGTEDANKYQILMKPSELFAMVTYMDFVVATFVTFHMGILFRVPYLGPKLSMLVWDGKFIMDSQPWIKRMAFLGLITFVIFPTSTTGSIGGSIFGRILGLSRSLTVMGVLLGSILGNALMYVFSKQINKYIGPENYWLKVSGIVLLVVVILLLEFRYRRVNQKYAAHEKIGVNSDK